MPWLNNMNAAHLTSINKTSIMNRPIHPKPIIVIFFFLPHRPLSARSFQFRFSLCRTLAFPMESYTDSNHQD